MTSWYFAIEPSPVMLGPSVSRTSDLPCLLYTSDAADGKSLVLDTEGPSMAGDGSMAKYQDVITFLSPDHRTLTSRALGPDGQWTEFMSADYRRKI